MRSKILYLCTGHQNNEEKVEQVVKLLESLNGFGADVCFTTHVPNGLERISRLCKFLVYDTNNEFVTFSDAVSNISHLPRESMNSRFGFYRIFDIGNVQHISNTRFSEYHTKPAMSLLRSGVATAHNFGYEWIVYLEYDTILPDGLDVKAHFEKLSQSLDERASNGYFYTCEDGFRDGIVWPFMFLCRTSLFLRDEDFMAQWQPSNAEFVRRFGNLCIEEIIDRIARRDGTVEIHPASKIREDMGYRFDLMSEVSVFSAGHKEPPSITDIKKSVEFELMAGRNDDGTFDLNMFRWVDRQYGYFDSVEIEAWVDGREVFSRVEKPPFNDIGFLMFEVVKGVYPELDSRELRFRITVTLGVEVYRYCDFSFILGRVSDYFRLKGMEKTNR